MRGKFISFEGGEGSGKSTQVRLLAERLRGLGIGVEVTREPGGSPGAEIIRHVVLSGAAKAFGPDVEAILFAAARDDHLTTRIGPALARGRWVICDRFVDSTRVYQGTVGEVDARLIRGLERLTVGERMPDLTLILDVPPKVGLARAAARRGDDGPDRFEEEPLAFHRKLRTAYRALAEAEPQRCVLIKASDAPEAVAERVWRVVAERLDPATAPLSLDDAAKGLAS